MEPDLVLGIDLGTTNSCVAVELDGIVHVITDDNGDSIIPSYVYFDKNVCKVGKEAKNLGLKNPKNGIFGIKRMMGRKFDDFRVQQDMKNWPFEVVSKDSKPTVKVNYDGGEFFGPEDISAIILKKMKNMAEAFLGQTVKKAVITVPAHFDDAQRTATQQAGVLAGLEVLQLLSEPTSAALAYGKQHPKTKSTILVFDLGGGTFDISIVKIDPKEYKVLTTDGDTHLGGEDFDSRMIEFCIEDYKKKFNKDPTMDDRGRRRLKHICEKAKKKLSGVSETTIELNELGDVDFELKLSRKQFNEINSDYFNATMKTVDIVMNKISITKDDIDYVVLVGGSSRIPKIIENLQLKFGADKIKRDIHPDEAVAYGAAIKAASFTNNVSMGPRLCEVLPHTLGTDVSTSENDQKMMSKLLEKDRAIPCRTTETFCTVYDDQKAIYVGVYEGEHEECQRNRLLGDFTVENLPKGPANSIKVDVTFDVDINGILEVSATEVSTGKKSKLVISYTDKISPQEIKARTKKIEGIPVI